MDRRFRPLERPAAVAKALLLAVVLVDCVAFFADLAQWSLLRDAEALTVDDVQLNATRQAMVDHIWLGVYLAAGIAFVWWFHRAYVNAARLGATGLRHRSSVAVVAWLIPILALFWPKEIADDTWKASDPDLPPEAGTAWREGRVPLVFAFWWLSYVAANVLVALAGRTGNSLTELKLGTGLALAGDLVGIAAGILAVKVVSAMSRRQETRARRLGALATA
jgi:heme/copper-type cytochrome/quinol oxidase subunit 2